MKKVVKLPLIKAQSITYAVTVKDELEELKRLIPMLQKNKVQGDNIIVLMDTKDNHNALEVGKYLCTALEDEDVFTLCEFEGNFAEHKNFLKSQCSGDILFFIDADEYPSELLLKEIKEILQDDNGEIYYIPRINTVDGITHKYIQEQHWSINDNGWINFPDFQGRICKNDPNIKWVGKIHERLEGGKTLAFPPLEVFSLYHPKTIEKQIKQNNLYKTL